ncbi:hypothetical protein F4781DRAFT_418451 [Annulohypoxylon bovei var. microspora]|nr:hypothetical protein F4781DRAFT_418451 [Annulohypoxylon bovei var. microspora]
MVGVPGRSKGCNTCIRRRVKCSEEKPHCQRCIKSGFRCLGYVRDTQWRHFSTAPFPEQPSKGEVRVNLVTSQSSPTPGDVSQNTPSQPSKRIQVSRALDLTAFQEDFCFSFIFSNFVWRGYGALWLSQAAQGKLGHLALNSARALAQSYFGRAKKLTKVEIQGTVQYGKCLRGLWQELSLCQTSWKDDSTVSVQSVAVDPGSLHLQTRSSFLTNKKNEICNTPTSNPTTLRSSLLEHITQKLTALYCWRWRWQGRFGSEVATINDHNNVSQSDEETVKSLNPIGLSRWANRLEFIRPDAAADVMLYNAVLMWLLALIWDLDPLHTDKLIENCANQARDSVIGKNASVSHDSFSFSDPKVKLMSYCSFWPLRRPGAAVSIRDPAIEICRVFEWQSRNHGTGDEANFIYMFPIGMAISVLDAEPNDRRWIHSLLDANVLTKGYGGYGEAYRRQHKDGSSEYSEKISRLVPNHDKSIKPSLADEHLRAGMGMSRRDRCSELQCIKEFGSYVTREVTGADEQNSESGAQGRLNPGLVHLLLLRGRLGGALE